ncbi:MAG: hypothetical protein OXP10_03505, partial [Chloroflexota bacterium]|nr:hypothetical protein [Chloroflexota bacterium]
TPNLGDANAALSQLSYIPAYAHGRAVPTIVSAPTRRVKPCEARDVTLGKLTDCRGESIVE